MRYTEEEMNLMNEYETFKDREAELLDCLDWMNLSLAERNALECSLEFATEEMGSLRDEYLEIVTGRGR